MVRFNIVALSALLLWFPTGGISQKTVNIASPLDNISSHAKKVTSFGQRCDWSLDGTRLIFIEKSFSDFFEVEMATGELTPLAHHFFNEGFVRAVCLFNGDILLSGSKEFDSRQTWKSRGHEQTELWVLKRDLSRPPIALGEFCMEDPTASRKQMKITWTMDEIYMADIYYEDGI